MLFVVAELFVLRRVNFCDVSRGEVYCVARSTSPPESCACMMVIVIAGLRFRNTTVCTST